MIYPTSTESESSEQEQLRKKYREQITESLQNPINEALQIKASLLGEEPEVPNIITINGFSIEEARIFLLETENILGEAIDKGKQVAEPFFGQIRPEKSKAILQATVDMYRDKITGFQDIDVDKEFADATQESLSQHELSHIEKAYELGVDLKKASLSLYFTNSAWGIKPVLTLNIPETDPISDISISLAPKKPSLPDIIRVFQTLKAHKELFQEKPATTAHIIKTLQEKAKYFGYDVIRSLREDKLLKEEKVA